MKVYTCDNCEFIEGTRTGQYTKILFANFDSLVLPKTMGAELWNLVGLLQSGVGSRHR